MLTGAQLEDGYWAAMRAVTLGLVRRRGNTVTIGPLNLLRLGKPRREANAVEWPIEGGLLAGSPGGRWRVTSDGHRVVAAMDEFHPMLPRPLYTVSHQQVHLLATRLFLLRLRTAPAGVPARPEDRWRAAAVDVAFCLTLTRLAGLRLRPTTVAGILAGYHLACWSLSGRTLGGTILRQRVVARDGGRLTPGQAALRLAMTPLSWILRRPIHDEIASTEVISG